MRLSRFAATAVVACALLAASVSSASALTLGTTTFPDGATPNPCQAGGFYTQVATDATYAYAVPAGGGRITSWSTNTTMATPDSSVTLVVLRPDGANYTVVDSDAQTLPDPLPASNVATFALEPSILVEAGDVLGLIGATSAACYWGGGTITPAETVIVGLASTSPGATVTPAVAPAPGYLINVSAELATTQDVGLTASATPPAITAGGVSAYGFTVANKDSGAAPIDFSATVPAGLSIISAIAGSGTCTVSGASVSCTIPRLAKSSSAPVSIVVSAASAGSYAVTGKVSTSLPDPSSGDNSATATLTVNPVPVAAAPPLPTCTVVSLKGLSLTFVKQLLPALNCALGKVTKKASKSVGKGLVISTTPGKKIGLPNKTKVNVVTSSGPPKKKAKAKKKTKKTSSKK